MRTCMLTYHSKVFSNASTMTKTKRKVDERAWPACCDTQWRRKQSRVAGVTDISCWCGFDY